MTNQYKFDTKELQAELAALKQSHGDSASLTMFVARTEALLRQDRQNYKRFGVYWWAVKAILLERGKLDAGDYASAWLAQEYTVNSDPELTLLAAWNFADGNTFSPETEFEIDGKLWLIDDPEM